MTDPMKQGYHILFVNVKPASLKYFLLLFIMNGFITNSKTHPKQIPLLFCCMARMRAIVFFAIFQFVNFTIFLKPERLLWF